jgi:hypothetical protein
MDMPRSIPATLPKVYYSWSLVSHASGAVEFDKLVVGVGHSAGKPFHCVDRGARAFVARRPQARGLRSPREFSVEITGPTANVSKPE